MSYQGRLVENGVPANGTHSMMLRLYPVESGSDPTLGSDPIWEEGPKDVSVQNGLFQVVLGDTNPLPLYAMDRNLWLEVEVDGTTLPRQRLYGAPYAFTLAPGADITGEDELGPILILMNRASGGGLLVSMKVALDCTA